MRIALLGTGEMGSRMGLRLLNAGHALTVWNRTPDRTRLLVLQGAERAAFPREAAYGADVVISMVRDDEASSVVWLDPVIGALDALQPHAVALECSTLSVAWVKTLARECADRGLPFLDAPVVGSRPQAETGKLVHLVGGRREVLDHLTPIFEATGGAIHHVGPSGAGAAVKILVNGLFAVQIAALAELIGAAAKFGIDPGGFVNVFSTLAVCSPGAAVAARAMIEGNFAPAFPIELAAKDLDLLRYSNTPVCHAASHVFASAIAQGFAQENLTAVAKLYPNQSNLLETDHA